jgi:hypothetical protein
MGVDLYGFAAVARNDKYMIGMVKKGSRLTRMVEDIIQIRSTYSRVSSVINITKSDVDLPL